MTDAEQTKAGAPRPCPYYNGVKVGDNVCLAQRGKGMTLCTGCNLVAVEQNQSKEEEMSKGKNKERRPNGSEGQESPRPEGTSKEFKCEKCGKTFTTQHGLSRHMGWCGLSAKQKSEQSKTFSAGRSGKIKKPRKARVKSRQKQDDGGDGIFRVESFHVEINTDASLDDLRELRDKIEDAIRAKL